MAGIFARQALALYHVRDDRGELEAVRPSEAAFLPIIWTLITLSFCFLPIRFYTRWKTFHRFYWDDFLTLLAWLLSLALGILATTSRHNLYLITYASRNQLAPSDIPTDIGHIARLAIRDALISFMILYMCLWCIKFGFLIFFWRLGAESLQTLRWFWRGVAGFTAVCLVACFPALPYGCAFQEKAGGEGRFCGETDKRLFEVSAKVNAGLDVATDVLIMTIPLHILWRSMLPLRQKLGLAGVFGLVLITITVSIVRVEVTTESGRAMNLPWVVLWTSVEANIAVIVACVGSFRMLYVQHREKRSRSDRNTYRMTIGSRAVRTPRGNSTIASGSGGGFDVLGSEEALEQHIERDRDKSRGR